jgi:mono/diheme cytochrome c family protein
MAHRIAIAAALASVVVAAPVIGESEGPGADSYRQYCASCHGADGAGDGPVADSLKEKPADLRKLGEHFGTPLHVAHLIDVIDGRDMPRAHGTSDMPVWGKSLIQEVPPSAGKEAFKRGTIAVIIGYLESIQLEK